MQPASRTRAILRKPLITGLAVLIGSTVCVPASAQQAPAGAKPAPVAQAAGFQPAGTLPLDFDLTVRDHAAGLRAVDASRTEEAVAPDREPESEWQDEGIRREWSYRPLADGPEVTVAGLGGGRKKAGKLAQLLVNWQF